MGDNQHTVMGVEVDERLAESLDAIEECHAALLDLSRPRNPYDTTDEWLAIFYDMVDSTIKTMAILGNQDDLYKHNISDSRFEMVKHANLRPLEEAWKP